MGKLFNSLSENEKNMITNYINTYASSSGVKMYLSLDHILRFWDKEKEPIFSAFGNKLIITKRVEFEEDEKSTDNKLKKIIYKFDNIHPLLKTIYERKDKITIHKIGKKDASPSALKSYNYLISNIFTLDNAKNNVYGGESVTFSYDNGKKITIQKDTRFITAVHNISKAMGISEQVFEDFRLEHSRCLNQKKQTGELCLSIHPLDYMTSSDNKCGWTSCMSWKHNGEFRQGTVEMMNSPCVIVAYLKSDKDTLDIGGSEWNSKKWRQYFIVDKRIITSIKAYPYPDKNLTTMVLTWLKEIFDKENRYEDEIKTFCNRCYEDEEKKIAIRFSTRVMYNDFGACDHYCLLLKDIPENSAYLVQYSGKTESMLNGELLDYQELNNNDGQWILCEEDMPEEETFCCCECGECLGEDYLYWCDGNGYCFNCYVKYTSDDFMSGERIAVSSVSYLAHPYVRKIRIGVQDDEKAKFLPNIFFTYDTEKRALELIKSNLPKDTKVDVIRNSENPADATLYVVLKDKNDYHFVQDTFWVSGVVWTNDLQESLDYENYIKTKNFYKDKITEVGV